MGDGIRGRGDGLASRHVWLLAAVNLAALGSLTAPVVAGVPRAIAELVPETDRAAALATVLAAGSLAALAANPLFGYLSDRTRGRFGRRRPWMLGGAAAGLLALAGLGSATSLAEITVWWVLVQTSYNATMAAAAALLADGVADGNRGRASGLFTAGAFVGALPPLLLATLLPARLDLVVFVMPALALLVTLAALALPERDASRVAPHAARTTSARVDRAFWAVWVQRFAMQIAFGLTTSFTLYLIVDRMTGDAVAATPVATIATLVGGAGIVVGALVAGAWASRRGRYLPFLVLGAVGLASAAVVRAVAAAPAVLWIAGAVGGLAIGGYLAVNLALALRTVPDGRAGTYLGILNAAETLPGVITPLVAAALLRVGSGDPVSGAADDYVALYACAALVALAGIATIPALRAVAGRDAAPARSG